MNHQPPAKTIKRLNSCIQIKSTKINRRISITAGVEFCLDRQLIAEIEQIRASNSRLELDRRNLAILRHYALQNLPLEYIRGERSPKSSQLIYHDSTLTFTTQYSATKSQSAVTLVRSAIDLEGKISQQVKQQLYQDSLLLEQVSQAHYWLVLEILAQLPLQSKAWHSRFAVSCFYLIVAIACGLIWYFIPFSSLFKTAICLGIILLTKLSFKLLVTQKLKPWIIYHLLDGFLSKTTLGKQIGIKIISFVKALN